METGCIGDVDVKLTPSTSREHDNDDRAGAELLALALGPRADNLLPVLEENPHLIRVADPAGDTVLHRVARAGYLDTLCDLIEFMDRKGDARLKKKALKDKNGDGYTVLDLLPKNDHQKLATHLVMISKEEEAATTRNDEEITPYELAREAGLTDTFFIICPPFIKRFRNHVIVSDVEMAISRQKMLDASKTSKDLLCYQKKETGDTLLHVAVKSDHHGIGPLKEILKYMADNGLTDEALLGNKEGDTALHLAVKRKELIAAHCLVTAAPHSVYQVNHKWVSPLYLTVKGGHHDLVKHMFEMVNQGGLLACAIDVLRNRKHVVLAHLAIRAMSLGTLQTLMEHLPEFIDVTDEKGWRPLSYAANKGNVDQVNYILANFPHTSDKLDRDGTYPIHKAVAGGHVDIIQAFLKHCPDALQLVDKKGRSVLHIAVRYGKDDILTYLIENIKLNVLNLKDNEGKTYEDHAKTSV